MSQLEKKEKEQQPAWNRVLFGLSFRQEEKIIGDIAAAGLGGGLDIGRKFKIERAYKTEEIIAHLT